MKPVVYLADLRYNYSGVLANDCMPVGIGYMKAVMDRDLPDVDSRLFVYPDGLWDAISTNPPDVLMLSNYMWCEALSLHFAKLAKRIRPEMLVVLGGPNISLEDERQIDYVKSHPQIDAYVLGEGDFLAAEIVKRFLDNGMSLKKTLEGELPSSAYRRPDGEVVLNKLWDRHKEVDDVPSPWLSGALDEFFDGKLAPLWETNRGCPFTCTFCVQGVKWYTKVHNFSKERLREEIHYIGRRIHEVSPNMTTLRIADSNYGMFERDIEISGYIGEVQKKYGWPLLIDATTGKNRPERIIKSVEQVSGALVLYQAVQSLDENVLRNIKRSTIKLEAYEQLQIHMSGRGLRSNSDLILGLPGETLQTHLGAIRKLLDAGVDQVTNFQLMMLKGSELETEESRKTCAFETRFRLLSKNYGIYGGEKVFDVEEIAVGSETLSFEDYIEARKYALASVAFWHDNHFQDVVNFAVSLGIKKSDWLFAVLEAMGRAQGKVRAFMNDFVRETTNELFPTREACVEFYSREENFEKLLQSEIGDNLMHKYQAIACFHLWEDMCRTAMATTKQMLIERGSTSEIPDFEEFWSNFHCFVEMHHAHGATEEQILAPARATMNYDIGQWMLDGMPRDASAYKLAEPREFEFRMTEEGIRGIRSQLQIWTSSLKGLIKMMKRIRGTWLTRVAKPVGELLEPIEVLHGHSHRAVAAAEGRVL